MVRPAAERRRVSIGDLFFEIMKIPNSMQLHHHQRRSTSRCYSSNVSEHNHVVNGVPSKNNQFRERGIWDKTRLPNGFYPIFFSFFRTNNSTTLDPERFITFVPSVCLSVCHYRFSKFQFFWNYKNNTLFCPTIHNFLDY